MKLTIPIYVESWSAQGRPKRFRVRPLFAEQPVCERGRLNRALDALSNQLRDQTHALARDLRHDGLARFDFNPPMEFHRLELRLELRRRTANVRFFFVRLEQLGRRIAFTPSVQDLWFEVDRGSHLEDRAAEVLQHFFREQERDESDVTPEQVALRGTAWVEMLDLNIETRQTIKDVPPLSFAELFGGGEVEGETELFRVCRCLDRLYPDDLDRVVLRDREVAELSRLMELPDRRPVLLLGPRTVGKTAVVHEFVHRRVAARKKGEHRQHTWLMSPQRLISGMSFVGQWENRLLAILKTIQNHDHILYFDDWLALYHAGVTSQSELSAAHVLKPFIERQEVRLLAEMTPEVFRILRERDRGFADLFHVLPIREPDEDTNLRMQLAVVRQLEERHHCRFELEALPTAIDLERRYARDLAWPGKAALFLRRLAIKYRDQAISRGQVLDEFQAQTGLTARMVDVETKLRREEIVTALRQQVVGQEAALASAADVIAVAKARLNDPSRPLASFLFLGPTGVGKTQTAKALAAYLFGDAEKLVRIDMNEFVSPDAASRLVGTFYQPEGLLVAAVRRQPYAVLLLDEIEKAHPDVHDLLLQVLGEGRLTDAIGRTADFTNCLLILTSNLGARQAQQAFGFGRAGGDDTAMYVAAAERFFRPELFNRIDRVIPFGSLSRDDMRTIARQVIDGLFRREGLLRRRCLLQIEDLALDRAVELGYDPLLGARAMKRTLERQLTQPAARCLAAGLPDRLTIVRIAPSLDGIATSIEALEEVSPQPIATSVVNGRSPEDVLAKAAAALQRLDAQMQPLRPTEPVMSGQISAAQYRYFAVRDVADRLAEVLRKLREELFDKRRASRHTVSLPPKTFPQRLLKVNYAWTKSTRGFLKALASATDIPQFLKDEADRAVPDADEVQASLSDFARRVALLQQMVAAATNPDSHEQSLLVVRPLNRSHQADVQTFVETWRYEKLFGAELELETEPLATMDDSSRAFLVRGSHSAALTSVESGTHLLCHESGALSVLQVLAEPLKDSDKPVDVLRSLDERRQRCLDELARGAADLSADPFRLRPVVRIYNLGGSTIDLRTGLVAPPAGASDCLPMFLLASLPLPKEFQI